LQKLIQIIRFVRKIGLSQKLIQIPHFVRDDSAFRGLGGKQRRFEADVFTLDKPDRIAVASLHRLPIDCCHSERNEVKRGIFSSLQVQSEGPAVENSIPERCNMFHSLLLLWAMQLFCSDRLINYNSYISKTK